MSLRFAILLLFVIALAGATIWLAFTVAGLGVSPMFVAAGPLLLGATVLVHWHRSRR